MTRKLRSMVWHVCVPCNMCSVQHGCSCAVTAALLTGLNRLCSQPGDTRHVSEQPYRSLKRFTGESKWGLTSSKCLNPWHWVAASNLVRRDLTEYSYCLLLSRHFVTSFQLCNSTVNTQHLVSVWSTAHQCLKERICWLNSSGAAAANTAFPLMALAFSRQPVWSQWYVDGICWLEFIDTTH